MQHSDDGLTEVCLTSELVLEGGMLRVKRDQVRLPSGNQSQREFIMHPGAVLVIPLLDNGNLLLERQFRYPLNRVFIELPAGKIDPDEAILVTGQRELLEETGYTAQEWVYLGLQHPCIGYSDEVIYMFIARGLLAGEAMQDEDEQLELFEASLEACLEMVAMQQITDAKTILALMYLEKHLQGIWPALPLNPLLQHG
ncbi:MAG: NUDIX hydrolase [Methylophilaceae bacterium]|jgi:ADP-ribose pyrophosphatase